MWLMDGFLVTFLESGRDSGHTLESRIATIHSN